MDYAKIFQPLFNPVWYLISLAMLAAVIKSSWFKHKGEQPLLIYPCRLFALNKVSLETHEFLRSKMRYKNV